MKNKQRNWEEIIKDYMENGESFSKTAHKWKCDRGKLSRKYYEYISNLKEEDILKIENKKLDLEKTRYKNSILKKDINQFKREEVWFELIRDKVKEPSFEVIIPKKDDIKKEIIPIVCISDFHYESENDYKWFDKFIKRLVLEVQQYRTIKLILGGDFIEGKKHTSQIENSTVEVQQVIDITNILVVMFEKLMVKTQIDGVYVVNGNHDRTSRQFGISNSQEGFTPIIVNTLSQKFPSLKFNYHHKYLMFEHCNKKIFLAHGQNQGRNNQSVVNWFVNRYYQINFKFDYAILGHFHRSEVLNFKGTHNKIILLPAIKNGNISNEFEDDLNLKSTLGFTILEIENKKEKIISIKM